MLRLFVALLLGGCLLLTPSVAAEAIDVDSLLVQSLGGPAALERIN
jgi:hypothetical protein